MKNAAVVKNTCFIGHWTGWIRRKNTSAHVCIVALSLHFSDAPLILTPCRKQPGISALQAHFYCVPLSFMQHYKITTRKQFISTPSCSVCWLYSAYLSLTCNVYIVHCASIVLSMNVCMDTLHCLCALQFHSRQRWWSLWNVGFWATQTVDIFKLPRMGP